MADSSGKSAFAGTETLLEPGMWDQMQLAWRLFRDPRTGWLRNAIPLLAVLYVFFPLDIIPDLLPGVGQVDDVGVLVAMVVLMVQLLPKFAPAWVVNEHLRGMGKAHDAEPAPESAGTTAPPTGRIVDAAYRVRD